MKNGTLYFFNPENEEKVQFTEETDTVFNCVYSDTDNMFYYTVVRNGTLSLKHVDLSVTPVQPSFLINLVDTTEWLFHIEGKAALRYIKNNLFLECNFDHDIFYFSDVINYSVDKKNLTTLSMTEFKEKYDSENFVKKDSTNDYTSIYDRARNMVLSDAEYLKEYEDYDIFPDWDPILIDVSADGSKIAIGVVISFVNRALGPYCVANVDGTMTKILEGTNVGYECKLPLWSNNNLVYFRETEKDVNGHTKWITELCYVRNTDNAERVIDTDADYFAVRKQQPIK